MTKDVNINVDANYTVRIKWLNISLTENEALSLYRQLDKYFSRHNKEECHDE